MMLLRANVLAQGYSGARREVLDYLVGMLNDRVHPVIPSKGSVGASGDLAPLAHLALAMIGEGEFHNPKPETRIPLQLEPKEGLPSSTEPKPSARWGRSPSAEPSNAPTSPTSPAP